MRLTKIVIDTRSRPCTASAICATTPVRGLGGGGRSRSRRRHQTFVFENAHQGPACAGSASGGWGDLNNRAGAHKAHVHARRRSRAGEDPHAGAPGRTAGNDLRRIWWIATWPSIRGSISRPRSIADDEYYLAHYVPPTWRLHTVAYRYQPRRRRTPAPRA